MDILKYLISYWNHTTKIQFVSLYWIWDLNKYKCLKHDEDRYLPRFLMK